MCDGVCYFSSYCCHRADCMNIFHMLTASDDYIMGLRLSTVPCPFYHPGLECHSIVTHHSANMVEDFPQKSHGWYQETAEQSNR